MENKSKPVGVNKLGKVDKELALFVYPNDGDDLLYSEIQCENVPR